MKEKGFLVITEESAIKGPLARTLILSIKLLLFQNFSSPLLLSCSPLLDINRVWSQKPQGQRGQGTEEMAKVICAQGLSHSSQAAQWPKPGPLGRGGSPRWPGSTVSSPLQAWSGVTSGLKPRFTIVVKFPKLLRLRFNCIEQSIDSGLKRAYNRK